MSEDTGSIGAAERNISVWTALGLAIALLIAVRLLSFGSVVRGEDIVLLSNDPYGYLYSVEYALTDGTLSRSDPEITWLGEPLLVWGLAFVSVLFGGVAQADLVLAWYPVVTAVVSGLLVFLLSRLLTDDARIGVAAVVLLAVTPIHVSRTALGAADHHAFDYMWLLLTATALTWLVVRPDADDRYRWAASGVLGIAVAGQTLAFEVSPLFLVPTAGALAVYSLVMFRTETPTRALLPFVVGFGLAAVIVQLVHRLLFWHSTLVAGTPVLLFLGALGLMGAIALVRRMSWSWPALLGGEVVAVVIAVGALWLVMPGIIGQTLGRLAAFGEYIQFHQQTGIGETSPITAAFGPVAGPIVLLGFSPFLGLPVVGWGILRGWRRCEPGWLVLPVYVVWFLGLAFVQRRWAVQLGLFLSVFGAVGLLMYLSWVDLVRPPVPWREDSTDAARETIDLPDRQRLALLGALGVVGIGGASFFSRFILSRISIDEPAYRAAVWMREYAAINDWRYPENYVLAQWDRVRMYNYFVNGQSRSYDFARDYYSDFVSGSDAEAWYQLFTARIPFVRDQVFKPRVRFVVTRDRPSVGRTIQTRLHDHYGSASDFAPGVGNYRVVWESDDRSVKVFTLVPGATVTGEATPNTEFTLSTPVTIAGTNQTVEYRRRVETDGDGAFSVVLAHPGEYEVDDGSATLTVTTSAVRNGGELSLQI